MIDRAAPHARRGPLSPLLPASFYARETELVARDLLGAVLECETESTILRGRIVETEAYLGEHDPACHAAVGETPRTRWLYGPPGTAYVYFIYGVHWCFNAVTRPRRFPSAVLVRALEPLDGIDLMRTRRPRARHDRDLTNGPGKLCAALGIDGRVNGLSLYRGPVRIRRGAPVADADVLVTPRVGITRAVDWPLRWIIQNSSAVSAGAFARPAVRAVGARNANARHSREVPGVAQGRNATR